MKLSDLRPALAELVGTFFFVLAGTASVVATPAANQAATQLALALAHGLALGVAITVTMPISGGHLNPAVTLGMWLAKRVNGRTAGFYVLAQLLGAVLAALTLKVLLPPVPLAAMSGGLPQLSMHLTLTTGLALEALFTAFLMSAVFGIAVAGDAPRLGGLAIGLVVTASGLAVGPLTGAALNPARVLGPALVFNEWHAVAAYCLGPLIGAGLAALLWDRVLLRQG